MTNAVRARLSAVSDGTRAIYNRPPASRIKPYNHPRRSADWGEAWACEDTRYSVRADASVAFGEVEALLRVERSA